MRHRIKLDFFRSFNAKVFAGLHPTLNILQAARVYRQTYFKYQARRRTSTESIPVYPLPSFDSVLPWVCICWAASGKSGFGSIDLFVPLRTPAYQLSHSILLYLTLMCVKSSPYYRPLILIVFFFLAVCHQSLRCFARD